MRKSILFGLILFLILSLILFLSWPGPSFWSTSLWRTIRAYLYLAGAIFGGTLVSVMSF